MLSRDGQRQKRNGERERSGKEGWREYRDKSGQQKENYCVHRSTAQRRLLIECLFRNKLQAEGNWREKINPHTTNRHLDQLQNSPRPAPSPSPTRSLSFFVPFQKRSWKREKATRKKMLVVDDLLFALLYYYNYYVYSTTLPFPPFLPPTYFIILFRMGAYTNLVAREAGFVYLRLSLTTRQEFGIFNRLKAGNKK